MVELVLVEVELLVEVLVLVDVDDVEVLVLVEELVDVLVDVDVHVKLLFPNKNSDILLVFCDDYASTTNIRVSSSIQCKIVLNRENPNLSTCNCCSKLYSNSIIK